MSSELYSLIDTECNPSQKEAVFFGEGPLLVIAGAGSGKTKTLVYRVARLIDDGVAPERILLLTFTRKASEEMLKRASTILDHRCQNVSGGTFHAFANVALRKYASYIGFDSQFTILDRSDCEDLIQSIRKEKGFASAEKRFPKKGTLLSIISKSINTSKDIQRVISADYPQFIDFSSEIESISKDYNTQKKQMQVMDYDDLLTKFLELLQQNPDIQQKFREYYHTVMVDEYQDTNSIQAQIIQSITNDKDNIMVVGDDAQSIYSFRGAHFENIIKFPELFSNTTVVKLEQNYRSTQPILDLTNALISHAKQHFAKTLFTENSGLEKPFLVESEDDNSQSQFICKKILSLREEGTPLSEISVLIRSGWHSNDLELELKGHNIPFVKMGGFKFVETSHVKDVISYFRILYNPIDTISWTRVLLLLEGCGPGAAKKITDSIKQSPSSLSTLAEKFSSKKFGKELSALISLVTNETLKQATPSLMFEKIMTLYKPHFKLKYDDFNKRQSDIDSFATILEKFKSLESMVVEMSLDPPSETQSETLPDSSDDERITISTIHSSKGLEWGTVFLLSAIDGYLPSFQSLGDLGQLEEERRLMYVALTRAKSQLFIMKPNLDMSSQNFYRFSGMQFSSISRFLDEISDFDSYIQRPEIVVQKRKSNFSLPMDDKLVSSSSQSSTKRKFYF
ncbi:hypothetical protein DID78_04175 [Candidatus Marinamargulisbacteria bacterium SCGC AG-343-D04]|nr:hypothetical protein DID78_04175 [Candidatus Marinamargulisbacteria bacterium SCGC AG-343-D04]